MTPEQIALKMLELAVAVSPILADFIRKAVDANPDHPLSKRVEEVLPEKSASRAVAERLAGG